MRMCELGTFTTIKLNSYERRRIRKAYTLLKAILGNFSSFFLFSEKRKKVETTEETQAVALTAGLAL